MLSVKEELLGRFYQRASNITAESIIGSRVTNMQRVILLCVLSLRNQGCPRF